MENNNIQNYGVRSLVMRYLPYLGTVVVASALSLTMSYQPAQAQVAYGSYVGVGPSIGLSDGIQIGGVVAFRYKLLEAPVSFRAQALIADLYVTADLRHHPASEAREAAVNGRPYLIDVSHFASEWLWLPAAAEALGNVLTDQGLDVEIRVSTTNSDPWDFILTPG
jgi:hypothetical protein